MSHIEIIEAYASWVLSVCLIAFGLWAIYLYVLTKPKGRTWRCHFGLHDWERFGHRRQCRRCGARQNDSVGLHRLRMSFKGLDRLLSKVEAMHAAKQQDWQTPPAIFRWMQGQLGFKFTLDPCTSADNPLGTPKFYTEEDDGLKQSWEGEKVYMNPPYGNLPLWVEKAHDESSCGDTAVVALLPVRTSPKYMRTYVWTENAVFLDKLRDARDLKPGQIGVYFLPKRVRFIDPNTGKKTGSPYFDSMVVVWR